MKKTAYDMRISDWSSDVCSSDLTEKCARHSPLQIQPGHACIELPPQPLMRCASIIAFVPKLSKAHLVQIERVLIYHQIRMALKLGRQIGRASCRERVCQSV